MSKHDIDTKKEEAFITIRDILFDLPDTEDELEKAGHILDVLEQLMARIIAGSSLEKEHILEICDQSHDNIKTMALQFLEEELQENESEGKK